MSDHLSVGTAPTQRQTHTRTMPIGAECCGDRGTHFRVWAPRRSSVEVVFEQSAVPPVALQPERDGYFAGHAPDARPGTRYRFRLDGEDDTYPDPASRFQPDGPHGASQIVDPKAFSWSDADWRGVTAGGQVLYEMHVGTFTREGTWAAAARHLRELADLGITCLEVMPVNEFAGRFGWGYDGVALFAPHHHYGTPDDMRRFIDQAHALGIGVILDLVYNHLGPDGNAMPAFSEAYFSPKHGTDWGDALNFDGEQSRPVREFFVSNALYWIREFHIDGFRFDATQSIVDESPQHILAEICEHARRAAGARSIYVVNENEPQDTKLVRPIEGGGYGMDSLWNDDFHHSAMSAISGHHEAYYADHPGTPQEFISTAKYGYLFQGQRYRWQGKRRGTATFDLPPTAFVHFLQNHDQIGNSGHGYRVHQVASPGEFRAMTTLLLLMPQTPLLFQGQEWAASSTFRYFADHKPELDKLIRQGRARELSQFPSLATPEMQALIAGPSSAELFEQSKLDHDERQQPHHQRVLRLHKDLIQIRKTDPAFNRIIQRGQIDGAVLAPNAFVLRYFLHVDQDRLLIVNLGGDIALETAPEPLLAPPSGKRWAKLFSTEDPQYGGSGTPPLETEREGWFLPGRCAVVLMPLPEAEATIETRIQATGIWGMPRPKPTKAESE